MRSHLASHNSPVFSCESEEHLKWAFWGSGDALWDWDLENGLIYRRGFAERLNLDTRLVNSSDRGLEHLVHPGDLVNYREAIKKFRQSSENIYQVEYRVRTRTGSWIWLLDRGKVVTRSRSGVALRAAGTCRDITVLKNREQQFRLASQVIKCMNEAVLITTLDQRVVSVNRAFCKITEFGEHEIMGRSSALLHSQRHPETFYEEIRSKTIECGNWHGEVWQRQKCGSDKLSWMEMSLVHDERGRPSHLVGVFSDVTERKQVEEKLWHLANYDMLTGLPCRSLFNERLEHALRHARRQNTRVALLFLDLDHFKCINDSMGHHVGDDLLRMVADRLQAAVREADTVARLGGDEFTIILENLDDRSIAEDLSRKVIETLSRPFPLQEQEVCISASIGICVFPDDGCNAAHMVQYADTAMYQAKAMGRHNFQFYTEKMNQRELRRLMMTNKLRRALREDEFHLVYQPKKSVRTGRITGLEALLRWNNPELGLVNPAEFIPLAEEIGIIVEVGEWVLEQACLQCVRWQEMGIPPLTMAVNLSAVQFMRADMVSVVSRILEKTGLDAQYLELELTESLIMQDTGQTIETLRQLKSLGLRVALDDFGTGYSSLSYLTRFPIDTLKIDKTFIANVTSEPSDAAITNAIIAMAHALKLNIIAEGVETQPQRAYLEREGCDELQGYLFSKPLDVTACTHFLEQSTS